MVIHPVSVSQAKVNSLRQYRRSPDPHLHGTTTNAGVCWLPAPSYPLQATSLLLPNRSVPVHPFTLKEAVMHHAYSEEQNQEKENHHKQDRDDSRQGSLLFRAARQVRILIHPSRLNSSPRAGRDL